MSNLILYGGIAIIGLSLVTGIVFIIVLFTSKRKLNAKLDADYGKERFP